MTSHNPIPERKIDHIGTTSAEDRSWVKLFDRVMYRSIRSQLKQSLSGLALIAGLLVLVPGEALASQKFRSVEVENFFDFEQAKAWWRKLPYAKAAKMRADCKESPHWAKWQDKLRQPHHKEVAEEEIAWTWAASTVRRCADLDLNWRVFESIYGSWRRYGHRSGWVWPQVGGIVSPDSVIRGLTPKQRQDIAAEKKADLARDNIFTHDAESVPDWRSPEQRAEDAAAVEAFRAKTGAVDG